MLQGSKLDALIDRMLNDYLGRNRAAKLFQQDLDSVGVGIKPVIDHLTLRTLNVDKRAEEYVALGYTYCETIEYQDWYAKVYRAPGYPALFVDQAYDDDRGKTSVIPPWVNKFGDQTYHHIAVLVEDIERCIERLKKKGVTFAGPIVGERGETLRQIFTVPEQIDGQPFSVLELAERHQGYQGFSPPKADSLMQSTVKAE